MRFTLPCGSLDARAFANWHANDPPRRSSPMSANAKFEQIANQEGVPHPPSSVANYVATRRVGDVLYVSGQAPFKGAAIPPEYTGKVGGDITQQVAKKAARITAINLLYNVQDALGTLDNVDFIIAVDGMVNCTPDFKAQSAVIDGCSDLLVEVFGDAGKHTRSAVGQIALAFEICVEIKLTVKVR